jgi:hypothetical protein
VSASAGSSARKRGHREDCLAHGGKQAIPSKRLAMRKKGGGGRSAAFQILKHLRVL